MGMIHTIIDNRRSSLIIHFEIDDVEIDKIIDIDLGIKGDLRWSLPIFAKKLKEGAFDYGAAFADWRHEVLAMKKSHPFATPPRPGCISPQSIFAAVRDITRDDDTVAITDVGQHQMWSAQYFKYKEPRTFLTSGGLGTMGYGLGAAIGAKMGRPDKTVVNIAGDGCFRMNMNEIATAVRCHKQLLQIVMNNHVLGMVRQWQTLFYDHRYSHTVLDDAVDFVKISEGMGAKAFRVTKMEEVEPAIRKALAMDEPVVLDCWIDQDLSVFPMVPAGASLNEVFDEEDMKNNEQSV